MVSIHAGAYIIQSLEPHHIPGFASYLLRNRTHLQPFEPCRPDYYFTEAYWRNVCTVNETLDSRRYVIIDSPEHIIGYVNLFGIAGYPSYSASLGYSLDYEFWGKGIMTAVLSRFIGYLFDSCNFHRLEAAYMPSNAPSGRVLEKLGFEEEGYAKDYLFINGAWKDHILTSLVSPCFILPSLEVPFGYRESKNNRDNP